VSERNAPPGRISGAKSYAASVEPGQVIVGGTVGEVVESRHPGLATGDVVLGYDGWQSHAVSKGGGLRKLDPKQAPVSTALGVLGMPGMTAYVGLLDIGQPKPGETVVVSAASGAVGSAVGQIAKIKGGRAVGVAGSQDKCDYVVRELGFDAYGLVLVASAALMHEAPDSLRRFVAVTQRAWVLNADGACRRTCSSGSGTLPPSAGKGLRTPVTRTSSDTMCAIDSLPTLPSTPLPIR